MSSIHNRITTTFSASAGNTLAVMGQISGGMLGIGRSSVQGANQVGVYERQLRAFGTTLRYAIAGTAIFAIPGAVRSLSQLQQQLGLMSAIGSTPGGLPIVGDQLQRLGTQAQEGAVRAITPINDFNAAVVNFLSTVQNVPEDQISPIVTDIAQAARLAQIPVEDATKAFTTMSVAFGRKVTRADIHRTAQEFFTLTQQAPGGAAAGGQIVQQLGQLSQVTRIAGGTRPQLFGLLLSGLRSGIPPSQLGRGLQFLIQTVGLPGQQTKESEMALGSVGIRAGQQMPLLDRLNRIFTHARKLSFRGNIGNVARLDEDTLSEMDAQGGTTKALAGLGITGPGAVFLGQVFHRIHALRAAIALLGQFDTGQYQKDIQLMAQDEAGHVKDINNISKAWERFRSQAQLSEAGVALQRMGLQVARIFQPVINFGARGATGLSGLAARHPSETRDAVFGLTGLLGLLAARRGLGATLGLGGRILGRGLPIAATAENLATGGIPKGTASDPLFVIVMAQLAGGRGFFGPGGGPRVPGGGGRSGGFLPLGAGAAAIGAAILSTPSAQGAIRSNRNSWLRQHYPSLYAIGVRQTGLNASMDTRAIVPQSLIHNKWIRDILQEHSVGVANRMIRDRLTRIYTNQGGSMAGMSASGIAEVVLKGNVELNIDYNLPDGSRQRKKVHVRMDNWGNGNAPQHRGRNKTHRR